MAWPSGTKASTNNVDAPNDLVANARADIKQNIDNVNAIIDEFNISSPSDGDLLQYSSSSSKWEQVATSSVGSQTKLAVVKLTSAAQENVSANIFRKAYDILADGDSVVTEDSASAHIFTLQSGTYYVEIPPHLEDTAEVDITLFNETDSATVETFTTNNIGSTGVALMVNLGDGVFTIGSAKEFSFRQDDATAANRNATPVIKIFKVS